MRNKVNNLSEVFRNNKPKYGLPDVSKIHKIQTRKPKEFPWERQRMEQTRGAPQGDMEEMHQTPR